MTAGADRHGRADAGAVEPDALFPFELDAFQRDAIGALDAGASVLVAAPTGAGKTVVADYAVARALAEGTKAFYTTPIKALSNQKFGDLVRRHGAARVGLLTGDNAIRPEAPVVVMTTEVLRNMLYGGAPVLAGLRYVVLDEVHYLQDPYRGPVWEEVVIHAPPDVRLVCLSATVSNADELADWITAVRGPTASVVSEQRPVELRDLVMVGDRASTHAHLLPVVVNGRPNPRVERMERQSAGQRGRGRRGRPRRRLYTPRREEVVERLAEEELLPAIYFVFSRAGCDEAARRLLDAGVRLTDDDQRARIAAIVEEHLGELGSHDREVLGVARWQAALEAGVAAHHAGLVPPMKEAVEVCFQQALVQVVFATETLALGVNMPARAVVIENMTKFGGERHELLTPAQYTQLTGRAGRRGIDEQGSAIALWSPFVPFAQVADIALSRSYELRSAFRPTYNMAANLVRRHDPDDAHRVLNRSFAQFQADRAVVRLERRLERARERLGAAREEATCERGDVEAFLAARARARAARRDAAPRGTVADALVRLRPGDVIGVPDDDRAVVVGVAQRRGRSPRLRAVTGAGRLRTFGPDDFADVPRRVARVDLPAPYDPHDAAFRDGVAAELRELDLDGRTRGRRGAARAEAEGAVAEHPVAACPDLDRHVRAARRVERLGRDVEVLESEVRGETESLARQFDRVLAVLEARGHLAGWSLTESGERLRRVYHEADLLVVEALEAGLLDGLGPAELAALVSCLTYETRGPGPPPAPTFPTGELRRRWQALADLAEDVAATERTQRVPPLRAPDPGFVNVAHGWAGGADLDELLAEAEVTGGDFVRNVKQLLDLVRQLADVAPRADTTAALVACARSLFRDVIVASSTVGA